MFCAGAFVDITQLVQLAYLVVTPCMLGHPNIRYHGILYSLSMHLTSCIPLCSVTSGFCQTDRQAQSEDVCILIVLSFLHSELAMLA